jgi:hypothetical protein
MRRALYAEAVCFLPMMRNRIKTNPIKKLIEDYGKTVFARI